jgi:RND family efflux transporter MFP subunit
MIRKIIIVMLAAVLVGSCGERNEQKTKAPTRVRTEVVTASSNINTQTYIGVVEEREATAVSFTSMGIVKRMPVSEGQVVSRGQLIAEIDDTQARNMLSGAQAAMDQATDAYQRYKMLHDAGSLPEVQWVEIQSKVAQAKAQLDIAKKNLADCRLKAPVSGIIGRKQVGIGETASPSQSVVSILDISSVKVKVAIPETEIGSISANTPSVINVEAIGRSYTGGRIEKGVTADALTHTYDVRINVSNSERKLMPGMVTSVQFSPQQPSSAVDGMLTLPVTAVQRKSNGALFVWSVAKDSTAHRTPVSIGEPQGNRVVVLSGISENQRIVTEGYQKLSEGTKVVY